MVEKFPLVKNKFQPKPKTKRRFRKPPLNHRKKLGPKRGR